SRDLSVVTCSKDQYNERATIFRITAQLIDARSNAHVWSNRWDRPAANVFASKTELAEKVVTALGGNFAMGQIMRNELQRAKRLRPADLKAYDYFLLSEEGGKTTAESLPTR